MTFRQLIKQAKRKTICDREETNGSSDTRTEQTRLGTAAGSRRTHAPSRARGTAPGTCRACGTGSPTGSSSRSTAGRDAVPRSQRGLPRLRRPARWDPGGGYWSPVTAAGSLGSRCPCPGHLRALQMVFPCSVRSSQVLRGHLLGVPPVPPTVSLPTAPALALTTRQCPKCHRQLCPSPDGPG